MAAATAVEAATVQPLRRLPGRDDPFELWFEAKFFLLRPFTQAFSNQAAAGETVSNNLSLLNLSPPAQPASVECPQLMSC